MDSGTAVTLDALFAAHGPDLLRYLSRRVPLPVAEDLTSESFLLLAGSARTFDASRGGARAWLFGVATNLLRHHYRDEQREGRAIGRAAGQITPSVTGPEDQVVSQLDAQRRVSALASALEELNPDDREVLLLVAWGGLSPSEVASALGIPAGTARSRLNRVRRQLRVSAARIDDDLREDQS